MNRAFFLLTLAACGGPPANAVLAPPAPGADESGNAGRIICEAECRRDDRCEKGEESCLKRCTKIPDKDPPVWSAGWARMVARCIDAADCAHDREEGCVATSRKSVAGDTCRAKPASSVKDQSWCSVLDGLTNWAADDAKACIDAGGTVRECMPPLDWK